MKVIKTIAIILGAFVVFVLAAAFILPIVFKDRLVAMAKEQINRNVNARVEFADISLSLFRDFPDISLIVEDFSVTGVDQFENVPLARGESLQLTLDLFSVLSSKRPVELESIRLVRPDLNVYVLRDGSANYDIMKADSTAAVEADTAQGGDFEVQLREYSIVDGNLLYDDRSGEVFVQAKNLNHTGSGNFTRDVFDLETETEIASLTVEQGGIGYLNKAKVALDAVISINQPESKYTLEDNILTINAFNLRGDGFVQLAGDNYNLDLHLEAPENDFKNLLSLVPNAYIEGYEDVKATGNFAFAADIEGTYSAEPVSYPAITANLQVSDGAVQYPGLPLGINDIQTQATVRSPGGSDFDALVVDVPRLQLRIGDNPFTARFHLETPISDPDVDAAAKGTIDLAELQKAFPMEGVQELAGVIRADMEAKTRLSYIEQQTYDRVDMKGDLGLTGLRYRAEGLPPVTINTAQMNFTPQQVRVNEFDAQLGNSDLKATGSIDNILAYFSPKKTMTGRLNLRSNFFDANEWMTEPETTGPADTTEAVEVFDRFNFQVDAQADEIAYLDYRLQNTSAQGRIAPNRMDISNGVTHIGDSDFQVEGTITNLFEYLYDDGVLGGTLDLKSRLINLNQFMAETPPAEGAQPAAAAEELEPVQIPERVKMVIDADADRVLYTNIALENVRGLVRIQDQAVLLEDVTGRSMGGQVAMAGSYETANPRTPGFNLKFDLSNIDFQQAFNNLNTFRVLAPIGKFVSGKFNSSLIIDGTLDQNLSPQFNSLNAKGFLETFNAVVQNFPPLQAVGRKLNIGFLTEEWSNLNTKNWFEVQNGTIEIKPFDIKIREIPMTIYGRHSIDMAMEYHIKASIPRELMRQNAVGQAADAGLSFLEKQAGQLGINFAQGDYVNVMINLTGNVQKPQVGLNLLGTGGQGSVAESVESQVKEQVKNQIEEGKEELNRQGQAALDTAKSVAREQVDRATEEARKQAEEILKQQGQQAGGAAKEEVKKTIDDLLDSTAVKGRDDIQKELERFNPFKKKKKEPAKDTSQVKKNG